MYKPFVACSTYVAIALFLLLILKKEDGLGGYNVRVKFDNSSHVIAYDGKEYYVELQISYPEKCEEYVEDDKLIQKVIMQKLHDCIDPKFK